MKQVVLKPELRTPGGETVSIYLNDNWAGDLYLVYREGDVLTGTIQIDTKAVSEDDMELVAGEVRTYIEHLNAALGVEDSSVVMVYGDISSMVEMEPFEVVSVETVHDDELDAYDENLEFVGEFEDEDEYEDDEDCVETYEFDDLGSDIVFDDEEDEDDMVYYDDAGEEEEVFHLSVAYRKGEHTKYHLHDDEHHTLGIVSVDEIGDNVSGRVEFWERPDDEEANEVAKMLARTFGELGEAENISFTMNHADYHIGDMHLERRDFL
ncbi:hypothetical protein [Tumebacillus flagellatus]|uniref:Uncharacterized protein n=1 Tax=Tumebacillus flagellatus TaxID=1157490 RepID=A0A074LMC5_9BACL|nr:hypothetical protein [Tumebacillus flagellatus]KEO82269.1 hypothetical protein EL26_16600 [Tumebacillus flagellatus]